MSQATAPTLRLVAALPLDEFEHVEVLGTHLVALTQHDEEDYPLVRVFEVTESKAA